MLFQPPKVKLHLPEVAGRELAELQVDGYEPAKAAMVEKQVEVKVFAIHDNAFLPGEEGKISAEFNEKRMADGLERRRCSASRSCR